MQANQNCLKKVEFPDLGTFFCVAAAAAAASTLPRYLNIACIVWVFGRFLHKKFVTAVIFFQAENCWIKCANVTLGKNESLECRCMKLQKLISVDDEWT